MEPGRFRHWQAAWEGKIWQCVSGAGEEQQIHRCTQGTSSRGDLCVDARSFIVVAKAHQNEQCN